MTDGWKSRYQMHTWLHIVPSPLTARASTQEESIFDLLIIHDQLPVVMTNRSRIDRSPEDSSRHALGAKFPVLLVF